LFVILLLKDLYLLALVIFGIASISDGLDGFIARCYNQRTELGAYLDPIADKLLLIAAFISLAVLKIAPAWLTVIVISRDVVIVLGIAILTIKNIKVEINPSMISKMTTFAQLFTIFFTLLSPGRDLYGIKMLCYWVAALFTMTSGLHYIYTGMNILQNAMEANGLNTHSPDKMILDKKKRG
jgi:cardiolipin synthase